MVTLKILNLFAGIGGNRTLWGNEHEITAVEHDSRIAYIYHKRFPDDNVIVGDAWQYLLDHFTEFDIIWASPPCTTHTILTRSHVGGRYNKTQDRPIRYPDMRLYGMILLLKYHFRGKWIVENVKPYYPTIIKPTSEIGRHLIWASNPIPDLRNKIQRDHIDCYQTIYGVEEGRVQATINKGIDPSIFSPEITKRDIEKMVNNCVRPDEGKWILDHLLNKGPQRRLF